MNKFFCLLLVFITIANAGIVIEPENRSDRNITFTEQFTLPNSYPETGKFIVKLTNTEKAKISNEKEILDEMNTILIFLKDEKYTKTFELKEGKEELKNFKGKFVVAEKFEFTIESIDNDVNFTMEIKDTEGFKSYNLMPFLFKFFNAKEIDFKFETDIHFSKDDLMSESFNPPVLIHKTKILDQKITKFQRALIIESEFGGKGLVLDGITQSLEKFTNYTSVFLEFVKYKKPKRVLMIGKSKKNLKSKNNFFRKKKVVVI